MEEEQTGVSQANASEVADAGPLDTGAEIATTSGASHLGGETKNPPLRVRITAVNRRSHLDGIVRVCHRSLSEQQHPRRNILISHLPLAGPPERWDW